MKIEDQVCTLEQAKKLKELGIDQETEFYFRMGKIWHFREVTDWPNQEQLSDLIQSGAESERIFAAYTVAELGEMLPTGCQSMYNDHHGYWLCEWVEVWDEDDEPNAKPYAVPGWKVTAQIDDEEIQTEAEARAALLIHIIESKLITVEEINNRL